MEEMNNKVVSLAKYRKQTQAKKNEDNGAETSLSPQTRQALADLLSETEEAPIINKPPVRKRLTRRTQPTNATVPVNTASTGGAIQNVVGNNNQITQNINTTTKLKVEPSPGSIGAHGGLRLRITELVQEVEEYRRERLGRQFKYGSVQGIIAQALGLKKNQWQQIWLWDVSRAPEVIEKLEQARDNTMQGRINKAAQRPGHRHTRGHLFRLEKDYLMQLGWGDDKARNERLIVAGAVSRADLSDNEFSNWVAHLRSEVQRMYGEI